MRVPCFSACGPLCALLALIALPSGAWAQTAPGDLSINTAGTDDPQAVRVIISPYVWGASLGGNVGLAGLSTPIHLPFSDIFDHLDAVAMGNVEIVQGRMGAYLDAQYVKTSQQEQVLSLPVDLTIKITRISGGMFYKALVLPLGGETATGGTRTLSIEPTAGLRWTQLAIRAGSPILSTRKKARWADPFVGLRINADLAPRWTLSTEADAGGFGASSTISVNAQAYLGYRLALGGQPAILRVGYRYLKQDYDRADFTGFGRFIWDTEQKGPVLGLSIIF